MIEILETDHMKQPCSLPMPPLILNKAVCRQSTLEMNYLEETHWNKIYKKTIFQKVDQLITLLFSSSHLFSHVFLYL